MFRPNPSKTRGSGSAPLVFTTPIHVLAYSWTFHGAALEPEPQKKWTAPQPYFGAIYTWRNLNIQSFVEFLVEHMINHNFLTNTHGPHKKILINIDRIKNISPENFILIYPDFFL